MVDPRATARILGIPLESETVARLLEKMRHRVTAEGNKLRVEIAPYRNDILHERDLILDLLDGHPASADLRFILRAPDSHEEHLPG